MRLTLRPGALARRLAPRLSRWAAPSLLATLAACAMTPLPVAAQPALVAGARLEGFVGQARLHPGLAGQRARLEAVGARVLLPAARVLDDDTTWPARRLAIGAFVTSASAGRGELAARHLGAQADVRLTERPLLGRVEPLLSLGLGTLQTRRAPHADATAIGTLCPRSLNPETAAGCIPLRAQTAESTAYHLAVSPAVGVRVRLAPGLALRADARDVIVQRSSARHNTELAFGLSLGY